MVRKFLIVAAMAFAAVVFFASASWAGDHPLTEDQARRFVETLPKVEALGKKLEADGTSAAMSVDAKPKAGEPFTPYSNAVKILKADHPADHAELAGVVKPHGFSTVEWGGVGDRVMVAYFALKMAEEDPRSLEMMKGMDQSMLDMMPPEMKTQMESVFAMMETVKNAPEADREAVAAVKDDLDSYMENAGKS